MVSIAPSILAADFSKLGELVRETELGGADRIHVDVMDGHFVSNLSMGSIVVKGLRPVTALPLEVHLMVEAPAKFLDGFVKAGADSFIFHLEVEPDPTELIQHIRRSFGKKVGLAINPDFQLSKLEPFISDLDLILCMTVFPGHGGQAYIPESTQRIRTIREWVNEQNPKCEIEVDGGINAKTIPIAAAAGANVFVAGTAVFDAPTGPRKATTDLHALAANAFAKA